MPRVTGFNVQAFERVKGKRTLQQGRLREFKTETEALRAGEMLAPRVAGVIVFRIEADHEFEDYSEPVTLATHGEVPEQF
jgi:hypothetical protein